MTGVLTEDTLNFCRRWPNRLRGSGVLLEPLVPQQSTLRFLTQTDRYSSQKAAAGDYGFVLRAHEVPYRRRKPAELREARNIQRKVKKIDK